MATATRISLEEYLRTDYEPDVDYVDGVLEDRNVGKRDHSYFHTLLIVRLYSQCQRVGGLVFTEQRLQVSATRCRIPDICVVLGAYPAEQIFTAPPFLCIEILSPEDTMSRMEKKISDYFTFGVKYVWVIDPQERRGWVYSGEVSRLAVEGVLRTADPEVAVALADLLPTTE